jgi:hypothetical protein
VIVHSYAVPTPERAPTELARAIDTSRPKSKTNQGVYRPSFRDSFADRLALHSLIPIAQHQATSATVLLAAVPDDLGFAIRGSVL